MEDIDREVRDATDNATRILEKDGKVADADLNTVNLALKVCEQAIRIKSTLMSCTLSSRSCNLMLDDKSSALKGVQNTQRPRQGFSR